MSNASTTSSHFPQYVFIFHLCPDCWGKIEKKRHLWFSLLFCTQSQVWSGISQCLKSQHRLCFWLGLNQLEIGLSLNSNGLIRRLTQIQQNILTLPITSLVWLPESITHSASLLWQQINQQKEKLSASHNSLVCRIIKSSFLLSSSDYINL